MKLRGFHTNGKRNGLDTLDMGFDRFDARLQWQLAPELVCTPNVLDFGRLAPQSKAIRELSITNLNGPLEHCTLRNRDEQSWFRIVHAQGISGYAQAHMRIVVEVDTHQLRTDQVHTGWLDVAVAHSQVAIPLLVEVKEVPTPRKLWHGLRLLSATVGAILVLSGCLALVSATPIYLLLDRVLSVLLGLQVQADPNVLSFVVQEQDQLTVYNTQLSAGPAQALPLAGWSPTWAPDGAHLAYLAERDGVSQLYVTNLADAAYQLTTQAGPKFAPAWSPDGSKIALLAGPPGQRRLQVVKSQLFGWESSAQADGFIATIKRLFTPQNQFAQATGYTEQFAWAPAGEALLFDYYTDHQVRVMLVRKAGTVSTVAADSWHPTWSPSGDEIAAVSAQGLFRLPLGSETRHYLSQQPAARPAWSPNGRQLAFLVPQPPTGTAARPAHDLWVVAASGAQETLVAANCVTFAWSPDGRHLAYVTGDSQSPTPLLYLWVLTAGKSPRLVAEVNAPTLAWQPTAPVNVPAGSQPNFWIASYPIQPQRDNTQPRP